MAKQAHEGTATARAGYSALHDSVTGLLNGGAFGIRFSAARARATRTRKRFAVMSIDVAVAHEKKDSAEYNGALKTMADRLQKSVRAIDTVARIDHGKFAIILEDLTREGQAHPVTEKVRRTLVRPIKVGKRQIQLSARPSIKFYPTAENASAVSPLDRKTTPSR